MIDEGLRRELTIGFVGLGAMGWPMARNLHNAGFGLVVRDAAVATQERFAAAHPGVTDERWAKALTELGPAADHSAAHRAWWADTLR